MKRTLFILSLICTELSFAQVANLGFQAMARGDTICVNDVARLNLTGSVGDSVVVDWRDGLGNFFLPIPPYGKANHEYNTSGTYIVIAIAYLGASTDTDSLTVTVLLRANVDFSFTYMDTCVTTTMQVQFTDLSDPGLSNYQWLFGDSDTSTQMNPLYTYLVPNNYLVSLTAEDISCSNTILKTCLMIQD